MSFPLIVGTPVANNSGASATTFSITLPTGIQAGELLVVAVSNDGSATVSVTTPASGWSQLFSTANGTAARLTVFTRTADGNEASTITVTPSATEAGAWAAYRIRFWSAIEAGTAATGASVNPDPPDLNPAGWGTEDTLWFVAYGWDGNQAHTSYPSGFDESPLTSRWANVQGCGIATAADSLNAANYNPGTAVIGSEDWIANTLAVRWGTWAVALSSALAGQGRARASATGTGAVGGRAGGQARVSVTVGAPAFIAASCAGEARAASTLTAPGAVVGWAGGSGRSSATVGLPTAVSFASRGQSRARVLVRNDPGLGDARLDAITSEVLYQDERGPARVTSVQVQLGGISPDQQARATEFQVQLQGNQDPEGMEAKATHQNVNLGGNQNPELMGARMTWLSVQVLRVRGAPDLPLPPVRLPGCTMYNVIRAGEEESGQNATRGTYRRLSGDIFLYRRELLQRLRMAYFDAEDYSFTLTIPQGGP